MKDNPLVGIPINNDHMIWVNMRHVVSISLDQNRLDIETVTIGQDRQVETYYPEHPPAVRMIIATYSSRSWDT